MKMKLMKEILNEQKEETEQTQTSFCKKCDNDKHRPIAIYCANCGEKLR
ncbi:hypothetical protein ACG6P0_002103 [Enterococcus hirae]|nr:hypothetical protein [Enterococcus hirae]EMF0055039.1 hypothetical protein [Enterococcus hirae]EMF0072816.1 hypothetical protein [Enterococcus hirae]EMF0112881.1 hypothetical protein [Enterococcus hirae]EMF0134162.1 hypothetical protein [Enterococcus hirae]EMF0456042.1 hypothetical protein [Enterococcus hirae]